MHQKEKNNTKNPYEMFNSYYYEQYGDEWNDLNNSMKKDNNLIDLKDLPQFKDIKSSYFLDISSLECAMNLPVSENKTILDMCAAPGGKSLITAIRLNGMGSLVLNDISKNRMFRLRKVISDHLDDYYKKIVSFSNKDACKIGIYQKSIYDSILIDAPCSCERHVINDLKEIQKWSLNRPKKLSLNQFSLLCSAFEAIKSGGYILYSTCSINKYENEELIKKFLKRRQGFVEAVEMPDFFIKSEKLNYGKIILPHIHNFKGPMYYCLLKITKENG